MIKIPGMQHGCVLLQVRFTVVALCNTNLQPGGKSSQVVFIFMHIRFTERFSTSKGIEGSKREQEELKWAAIEVGG